MAIEIIVGAVIATLLQMELAGSSHEGESLYCELVLDHFAVFGDGLIWLDFDKLLY